MRAADKGTRRTPRIPDPSARARVQRRDQALDGAVSGQSPKRASHPRQLRWRPRGDNGYKVRNLLDSEAYQQIFGHVGLSQDKQSKSDWATNHGGESTPSVSVAVSQLAERTVLFSITS
jgi:hypothetical protein